MPTAGGGQAGSGAGDVTRIGITPDLDPMWFSLGDLEWHKMELVKPLKKNTNSDKGEIYETNVKDLAARRNRATISFNEINNWKEEVLFPWQIS